MQPRGFPAVQCASYVHTFAQACRESNVFLLVWYGSFYSLLCGDVEG